jgi:hypothetical protein
MVVCAAPMRLMAAAMKGEQGTSRDDWSRLLAFRKLKR